VSSKKLRFDGWVFDPESGDLEREGARNRLQEQPARVLQELIAHAGSVVTREQLIALLWPKGVVDFDTSLNTAIRKLRSALGDLAETPRYVETLPRRGYRFIGVLDADLEAATGASPARDAGSAVPTVPVRSEPGTELAVPQETTPFPAPAPIRAGGEPVARRDAAACADPAPRRSRLPAAPALIALAALVGLGLTYLVLARLWPSGHSVVVQAPETSRSPAPPGAVFNPPPHSIAVLPFVNMSGDKEQEYFSDGLTEELLNSLAAIDELQVAARTSAFSFKGKDTDIGTIARKLNVGAVLEGSVRRSGNTVRITAQLIDALTGFHLWSHTYDRDLTDMLKLQTEIAAAVASALKVRLLGDVAAKIELGGTRNPAAFDAYLRARKADVAAHGNEDREIAIAGYTEAIGLDGNYALAFANRSLALIDFAGQASGPVVRTSYDKALSDARKAIALTPDLAEGHLALARYFAFGLLDLTRANEEYERALALAPGNARALGIYGRFAVQMGHTEVGIAAAQRAVVLDPLSRGRHYTLGGALYFARRNGEAIAAFQDALTLDPEDPVLYAFRGLAYYALGDIERARASCESKPGDPFTQVCLAVAYDKLGRRADAEAVVRKFAGSLGNAFAYESAEIYAQWGNNSKALNWLDTALRLRDGSLVWLKADPLMDPLRKEPRFQAVMRELKFPN
jgi:TolB-like protein/DNA-binding winged helix-turn-helix (wHTH) protein